MWLRADPMVVVIVGEYFESDQEQETVARQTDFKAYRSDEQVLQQSIIKIKATHSSMAANTQAATPHLHALAILGAPGAKGIFSTFL